MTHLFLQTLLSPLFAAALGNCQTQSATAANESVQGEVRRQEAVQALKQSQLGQMFDQYIAISNDDPKGMDEASQRLVEYIFSKGGVAITAISALQVLSENLNRQGKLGNDE